MKKAIVIFLVLLSMNVFQLKAQTYFSEGFESGIPNTWKQEFVSSTASWYIQNGGLNGEYPDTAYSGTYNVILQQNSYDKITRLITPTIDLSDAVKAELQFGLANTVYVGIDELTVECRAHPDSVWVPIANYNTEINEWTLQELQIPDSLATATTAISFKGNTNYGGGICIDNIEIIEVGLVSYYVRSIQSDNFAYPYAPSGSNHNPVLRTIVRVVGNTGSLPLNSITFTSKNTDDNDIEEDGLSLFYGNDTLLSSVSLITTGANFEAGKVVFDNLSIELSYGYNVFWLTYNLKSDDAVNRHDNILDAKVAVDDIVIGGANYPYNELDPPKHQLYKEAIMFDNFESSLMWTLSNDFEVGVPSGLGGNSDGNPDPTRAVSGTKLMGNDLTGQGETEGDYENNLTENESAAVSNSVNVEYYRDLSINFWRWLNVDFFDEASIDARRAGNDWGNIWINNNYNTDQIWRIYNYQVDDSLGYTGDIQFRFALGPTDEENNQSGWNIDNFAVLGDYIAYDVGVTAILNPRSGCGHTDAELVSVVIENFGGLATPTNIPVRYSLDGGTTWVEETYEGSIPVGGSVQYDFTQTADFYEPKVYAVRAETRLAEDEVSSNNRFLKQIEVTPTYTLPYSQSFENGSGFWKSGGQRSTWELRKPHAALTNPYIDSAYHGQFCWVTNYEGTYLSNDSSYIVSPCFDLTGAEAPILEFALFTDFEQDTDGANVYYSVDNAETWTFLPTSAVYAQNWYSSVNVEALEQPGWSDPNSGWFVARNKLPLSLTAFSSVQFKITIETNDNIQNEGIAVDLVRLYEAPSDVAITSLISPLTACEIGPDISPIVQLENHGFRTVLAGEKIPLSVFFDSAFVFVDSIELQTDFDPLDVIQHEVDTVFYMDSAGDYPFKFINKYDHYPGYYAVNNDTIEALVSVTGMPQYNPFEDVTGKGNALSVTLDAGSGYVGYYWSTDEETQTKIVFVEDTYSVTVENENGCFASDQTEVINSVDNMELVAVNTLLTDQCERPDLVYFDVTIANRGENSFSAGDRIPVAFKVNDNEIVYDTIDLTADLAVDGTVTDVFTAPADLSEPNFYDISVFCDFYKDLDRSNDSIYLTTNTWGVPEVAFDSDTVYTANIDTLQLNAGEHDSYLWQDNSIDPVFDVVSDLSKWYYVTVDDEHNCGPTNDSIFVNIRDLSLETILNPVTACGNSNMQTIAVELQNHSGNTYTIGTSVPFGMIVNGQDPVFEVVELGQELSANGNLDISLQTPFDMSDTGLHQMVVWVDMLEDYNRLNDTVSNTIRTIGYPNVDLMYDTIFTLNPDTVFLDAGTQFDEYYWHDGSTTAYFEPDMDTSFVYAVTVTNNDGCGFDSDSVQLFTYNLDLLTIESPGNSCELTDNEKLKFRVRNNGPDKLYAGEGFEVAYRIDDSNWNRQTFTLNQTLDIGDEIVRQFSDGDDFTVTKRYDMQMALNFPYDASPNNDSIVKTIEVYGYPEFEINYDTIISSQLDTIDLIVTPPDFVSYYWDVDVNNDTLSLDTLTNLTYAVTVSDVYGCASIDTVWVQGRNLEIGQVLAPVNNCELTAEEDVTVRLYNTGLDTITAGESVAISMVEPIQVTNTLVFEHDIVPGDSIDYTFDTSLDFSDDQSRTITVNFDPLFDVKPSDNEYTQFIEVYGYPDFSVNYEEINSLEPDTIDLIVSPSTFASYLWNVGIENDTLSLSTYNESVYAVTVTDIEGCSSVDSIWVNQKNLELATLLSPENACEHTKNELVSVELINSGNETISAGSSISLSVTSPAMVTDVVELDTDLEVGASISHTFSEDFDFSAIGTHAISIVLEADFDVHEADNELSTSIESYGYPEFEINYDTIISTQTDTIDLIVTPSDYDSYYWDVGINNDTLSLDTLNNLSYIVTVSDVYGCSSTDSVLVQGRNLEIGEVVAPVSNCELTAEEDVTVRLYNTGLDTIAAGESLAISMVEPIQVTNTLVFDRDIVPGDFIDYTFETSLDFSDDQSRTITVNFDPLFDVKPSDNEYSQFVEVYGYPDFSVNYEEINSLEPDTIDLIVSPSTFASYLWNVGIENDTLSLSTYSESVYVITVTDIEGCSSVDSIWVNQKNLELATLLSPENACENAENELISVELINSGNETIPAGSSISLSVLNPETVTDVIEVDADLEVGASISHTFSEEFDFSAIGTHAISIVLDADFDVHEADNELSTTIETYGNPTISINYDTVHSLQPDTTNLIVTPSSYESYNWNVGVDNDTLSLAMFDASSYIVNVSDENGCSTVDSVVINQSNLELGLLLNPANACSHNTSENIQLRLYNSGNDILRNGTVIEIGVANPIEVAETHTLSADLLPGDSLDYTLSETVDLSEVAEYLFDITASTTLDVLADDNQLIQTIETYGSAQVDLGNEITISELPYELSPSGDYASYLWHDESTEPTFEINANTLTSTGLYVVTVTNQFGCTGSDSRRVHVNIVDWSAEQVLTPEDACIDEFFGQVQVQISSQSSVPVRQGRSFDIAYRLNGGDMVAEQFSLTDSVYPQQTLEYVFNTQVDPEIGSGNALELIVNNADDFNDTNNTLVSGFTIYNPEIDFGQDTLRPESFPYTLMAPGGFSSYEWNTGDFGQSIVVTEQGWYNVVVTDDFTCTAEDSVFVDDPISIFDMASAETMHVYPNPAKNQVFIEVSEALVGLVQIEFIGASGTTLIKKLVETEQNTSFSIDIQHLPEGLYLIKVSGRNAYAIHSLLINR